MASEMAIDFEGFEVRNAHFVPFENRNGHFGGLVGRRAEMGISGPVSVSGHTHVPCTFALKRASRARGRGWHVCSEMTRGKRSGVRRNGHFGKVLEQRRG